MYLLLLILFAIKVSAFFSLVIPTKILKDNRDIFSNFITRTFNLGISTLRFPTALKMLMLRFYLKAIQGLIKQIIDQSDCYQ